MSRARIAVLASGGGTNLQAILEHFDHLGSRRSGDVVLVASDRAAAGALDRARARDIATALLPSPSRASASPLDVLLDEHAVDLIVLAGFLRLVPPAVVRRFEGRVVNVHPALLPAFGGPGMYGLRVHEAVLASGATVSGATVHAVTEEYDRGAIIAQWPVPVLRGDDARALAERVLRVEHVLYPRVVDALAAGRIAIGDARLTSGLAAPSGMSSRSVSFSMHSLEDTCLADQIDRALGC